jgi:hypothetical protein
MFFLHIGSEKIGAASIQQILSLNLIAVAKH